MPPLLIVNPLSASSRSASAPRLDEGQLHLYAPRFDSIRGVLEPTWDERQNECFTVDAREGSLHAAFDDEPGTLETPIEFRIDPGALRLLVPPGPLA
jgi:hypothetical protein